MERIIVTGANGSGKSHVAQRLKQVRPDVPLISYDAIKLATEWQQKPEHEIQADLAEAIKGPSWILDGGPSLLPRALPHADALIWLDPSNLLRATRLALRPWKSFAKTRAEIPDGNVDWPLQQYRFAFRSLTRSQKFRSRIEAQFDGAEHLYKLRCKTNAEVNRALLDWAQSRR